MKKLMLSVGLAVVLAGAFANPAVAQLTEHGFLVSGMGSICLDFEGNEPFNRNFLVGALCHGGLSQRFHVVNGFLFNGFFSETAPFPPASPTGVCAALEVDASGFSTGNVIMTACGNANVLNTVEFFRNLTFGGGWLHSRAHGRCLEFEDGVNFWLGRVFSGDGRQNVRLNICNFENNQNWHTGVLVDRFDPRVINIVPLAPGRVATDSTTIIANDGATAISVSDPNVVAAGGGNVIAVGGGNVVAAGGGN